jgi:hypothetical protein
MPGLSRGAKLTWIALAEYAWSDQPVFPGQATLAATLEVGLRTVVGDLQELRKAGLLQSHRRGLGLTNEYTLLCPEDVPSETPTKSRRTTGQIRNIVPIRHAARCATDVHPETHLDTQPGAHPIKEETYSEETYSIGTTPHGVGADAPPPAQKRPRATKAPKPPKDEERTPAQREDTRLLAEAWMTANAIDAGAALAATVVQYNAWAHAALKNRDRATLTRFLRWMYTKRRHEGVQFTITPTIMDQRIGQWLELQGKPEHYTPPPDRNAAKTPPRFVPSMIPVRPKTKEEQEWDALVAARDAKRAAEAQATGGVP